MTPRTLPSVTLLQFAFLDVLWNGFQTGKEMRCRLERRGVYEGNVAFYRVIQRLKEADLVTAWRIDRDEEDYPGKQCCYELTEAGRDEVIVTRAFYCRSAQLPEEPEHVSRVPFGSPWPS